MAISCEVRYSRMVSTMKGRSTTWARISVTGALHPSCSGSSTSTLTSSGRARCTKRKAPTVRAASSAALRSWRTERGTLAKKMRAKAHSRAVSPAPGALQMAAELVHRDGGGGVGACRNAHSAKNGVKVSGPCTGNVAVRPRFCTLVVQFRKPPAGTVARGRENPRFPPRVPPAPPALPCPSRPRTAPGRHCACRASAGWTAAARRAGIQLAMSATARSATGVTPSVTRSVGPAA